jgi:hypothetical protein
MALATRIRTIAVVQAITANLGRGRAITCSEVALAQPPVMRDRNVGVAERDLRRLHRTVQIRGEHRSDAVVASPPTHFGGIRAATLTEPESTDRMLGSTELIYLIDGW